MKKILLVICFFLVNFSLLYAAGKADDVARIVAKKLSKEALEAGLKKADDAIRLAAKNADNWARIASTHFDDASRVAARRADDVARLGIKHGDDIIHDFTKVHSRNVASRLATKTDNIGTAIINRTDNVVRAGVNQGERAVYKRVPKTNGRWDGIRGDSTFFPDLDYVPSRGTQLQQMYNTPQTWKQIGEHNLAQVQNVAELSYERRTTLSNNFKKFSSGEIGFNYKKGEIDLTPFSYDTIDIRSFGYDRIPKERFRNNIPSGQGKSVFDLGDELLAKKWNWSKEAVTKYRGDYGLTWHERLDTHTLDLVTNDIHNLITHRGGHAVVNAVTQ